MTWPYGIRVLGRGIGWRQIPPSKAFPIIDNTLLKMKPTASSFLRPSALVLSLLASSATQATITLTNGFNAGSAQYGADATDLSPHATQPALAYTAVVPLTLENPNYGSNRLNDGLLADPAPAYIPTEESIINSSPPLTGSFDLVFNSAAIVGEIAVNLGYANRHAGDYTIKDGAGAIRGQFTSSGATADSFFASFDAPFSTDKLTVEFTVTGNGTDGFSASFREIEVFGNAVPEPATMTILFPAALGLLIRRRHRLA